MKKFISVLLALVMALSLVSVSAFATTLTIKEPEGATDATYAGYKILNATNNADNHELFAYTLNPKYTNVLLSAINGDKAATEEGYVKTDGIIDYIAAMNADSAEMRNFAKTVYEAIKAANITADESLKTGANDVSEGYWLIAQTSTADPTKETESLVMIDTAGKDSLEIHAKKDTVTVKKEVTDESQLTCKEDHQHTAACYDWSKTNECPIGSTVQFKIDTTVPNNMSGYKYGAYFIVGDTLSQGLTLDKNSIVVTIDGKVATTADYTVKFDPDCADGYTFQVALVSPKAHAGEAVVVEYSAVVNENAKLVLTGNPNEADVTYNPTDDVKYGGEPSEDGFPTERYEKPTGHTPKDFTITYVTGVKFLKIDGTTKQPLNGAEFTITGDIKETVGMKWEQKYEKVTDGETGTYYLLKDGTFTDQKPVTADYMKEITSETYVGGYVEAAETDPEADTDVIIDNVRYRESLESDFGVNTIYTLVKANADQYAETTPNYNYSAGWTELDSGTKHIEVVLKVDENGIAKLPGLANGTYHVTESKVPEGYNKIDDFDIDVTWNAPSANELKKGTEAQCTWNVTADGKTLQMDGSDYLYEVTVVNYSGTELPSTGGVGTTLFYVFGGILVTAAAVLFVTKKRMGIEK